ncbi:unnamed protein product, partial [Ixodes pacificus]
MLYGFFQCADAFLFVFTLLPLRFMLALWFLLVYALKTLSSVFLNARGTAPSRVLQPAEICDLLKGIILVAVCFLVSYVDTSMLYHIVKSQSVIKLYIFFNMLEVADKLFSSFGQDILDALFWTATEPRGKKREHLGVLPHLALAVGYVCILCAVTALRNCSWAPLFGVVGCAVFTRPEGLSLALPDELLRRHTYRRLLRVDWPSALAARGAKTLAPQTGDPRFNLHPCPPG